MAQFIIAGSKGTDDPTMATLAFIASKTAKDQGHDVILWPALKVVANAVQLLRIPIWVCSACAMARQIGESDLEIGSVMKDMSDYVTAVAGSDRNLSF